MTLPRRPTRRSRAATSKATEAVEVTLEGDLATGKAMLRDYINVTVGFEERTQTVEMLPKSLRRMFDPKGNPCAANLFSTVSHPQKRSGPHLKVQVER